MGRDKAWLPFGDEFSLQRVVRILGEVVSPIVVVAAADQELPPLPADVLLVRDEHLSLGPLAGLAVGLETLRDRVETAYVSSCDVPLLLAAFVWRVIELLGDHDVAIPRDGEYHHPLAAVYRTKLAQTARELIAANRLRPIFLFEKARTREIDLTELRDVDPQLRSLRNTNTPEDYAAALRDAGLE